MDRSGHTTLAEWTAAETRAQWSLPWRRSARSWTAVPSRRAAGRGPRQQVTELPVDADLVVIRRPIAGGRNRGGRRRERSGRQALPELASVVLATARREHRLLKRGRLWTTVTIAHVLPFLAIFAVLIVVSSLWPWPSR